ncbi:tkr-3 (predicted) [Pycnogonum litorale]
MYENGTNGTWPNGTNLYDTHVVSGLYQVPVGIIVLLSILYGTITLLAIVGNGLVIIVIISSRRMHSVTNYFIANLAVADILIGLFGIPFRFQAALLRRWNLPSFMCYMSPFAVELSVNVSIFSLAAIALDRYRAIMHPLKVRVSTHRAKMLIILIWILAVAVSIPYVVTYRVMLYENINTGVSKYFCYNAIIPQNIWRIYTNLVVGIQYIVPLIILGFAYTRMALRLWGTNVPGNAESERDAMIIRNKRKVSY